MKIFQIFRQSKYLLIAIAASLTMVAVAAWLPNLHLITQVMTRSEMTLWQKTNLIFSLLGSLQTNFSAFSRSITLLNALLTGIQVSLLVYYLGQKIEMQSSMGVSVIGIVSSMLGIGCASCGSVLLTTLFGLGSTTLVLGYFPLKGQEFGLLGAAILLLSIYFTIKKINQPITCKVIKEK